MTISRDDFNRALGLPSDSPLTQEDAAKKLREALDAQGEELADLRERFERHVKTGQQGK